MDSAELKAELGKDITFWGGGVDTQGVFGTGTPDDVRADVRRRLNDFMPGGGFVFNTVHNIQGNVPAAGMDFLGEREAVLRNHVAETERLAKRIVSEEFTLEDLRDQLKQMRKMGPLGDLLKLMPKVGPLKGLDASAVDEGQLKRIEAIINSMTRQERNDHLILNASRRKRIAKGSGVPNKEKVGKVTMDQVREIAEIKMKDLNAIDLDGAMKQVEGTARNMGITVEA